MTGNPKTLPFAERLSCTIDEACKATGLGRTKLYELIGAGQLIITTVGRPPALGDDAIASRTPGQDYVGVTDRRFWPYFRHSF